MQNKTKKAKIDLDSLIEEAIVDCYSEDECRTGFSTMMQDFLLFPFEAKINSQSVTVENIFQDNKVIKVLVRNSGGLFPVDVLDLDIDQNINGCMWIAAYKKWEKGA